jgi:hypothetical protein
MMILLFDVIIGLAYGVVLYCLLSKGFSNSVSITGGIILTLVITFVLLFIQGATKGARNG